MQIAPVRRAVVGIASVTDLRERRDRTDLAEVQLAACLRRVASGDHDAMAELYDQVSDMVYGTTLRILRDASAAEDVAIEVFSLVWRKAAQFDVQRGGPLTWILTLTRNRAIDRLRSRRREPATDSLDGVLGTADQRPNPEESTHLGQRRGAVRAALDSLPHQQRELIELAYFSGLSHGQIADQTAIPLGTIKTRIRAGMMRLRVALLSGDRPAVAMGEIK